MTTDKNGNQDGNDLAEVPNNGGRRSVGLAIGALLGFAAVNGIAREASAQSLPAGTGATDVLWADTVAALRAFEMTTPYTYHVAVLKGHSAPSDGGEGVFVWDATSTAADNEGIVVRPSNIASNASGRWVRVVEGDWNVCWFGAKGDGTTFNAMQFRAAIDAMGSAATGRTLYVPPGTYRFQDTLYIDKAITLRGSGGHAAAGTFRTVLTFPDGVTGLKIAELSTDQRGTGATIRDIKILGGRTGTPNNSAHGIRMRGLATIDNVQIANFSGNGIDIYGLLTPQNSNSSHWLVRDSRVDYCGQHGLFVDGDDANAGMAIHTDIRDCSGWGVYDTSFLGNTYIGMMLHANTLGSYRADGANNRSLFLGCYAEGDQGAANFFDSQSMAIGGLHGPGVIGWHQSRAVLSHFNVTSTTGNGMAGFGYPGLLSMQGTDDSAVYSLLYHTANSPTPWLNGWYALKWASSDGHVALAFGGSQAGDRGVGRAWAPRGIYVGNGTFDRVMLVGGNDPTSLPANPALGTICFHRNAGTPGASTGVAFWQCVAEAVGATPAKWLPVKHSVFAPDSNSLPRRAKLGDVIHNSNPGSGASPSVSHWVCVQAGDHISSIAQWRAVLMDMSGNTIAGTVVP